MASVVMGGGELDVLHVAGGSLKAGCWLQIQQVAPEVGIVHNAAQVAFEVDVIDRIEPIKGS